MRQSSPKTSFDLSLEHRQLLVGPKKARRGQMATALKRLIADSGTFFGLPAPVVALLDRERKTLGCETQRDYIVWLLMERHRTLRSAEGMESELEHR